MKLLGWMHRKFKQNGGEPFTIGNTCNCLSGQPSLDEQQPYFPQQNYTSRPSRNFGLRKSFNAVEEGEYDYEPSDATSELFHGLLAIGTLGSDPILSEPETPNFTVSFQNVTENDTDVTENDLKLINEELEKVLGADIKDESCSERTSHVSSVTLNGNDNGSGVCPLQGYLFGSPVGLLETSSANASGKKDHHRRTSLGELFQMSKIEEEKKEVVDKFFKKKRRETNSTTHHTADSGTETKLTKILQMFHKKVHPEGTTTSGKKCGKNCKNGNKNSIPHRGGQNNEDHTVPDEDIIMIPKRSISKIRRCRNHSNPPPDAIGTVGSNENRECWIKTDADYLVLEL